MDRFLSLLLLGGLSTSAACFSERLPPPTFRHDCSGDGDCGGDQACVRGLCQVPCTLATAAEDCDPTQGFLTCINGACVSTCEVNDDICPGEQSCVELPAFDDSLTVGVCMQECSDTSCPEGERCVQGFCAQTCVVTDPESCGEGQTCFAGVCVPEGFGESAGESDSASETATDGAESAGTAGETE